MNSFLTIVERPSGVKSSLVEFNLCAAALSGGGWHKKNEGVSIEQKHPHSL